MNMIEFNQVSLKLGDKQILKDISFEIEPNELVAMTGASGTGKTTMLRLIAGSIKPDTGTVTLGSNKIGFVFQDHRLLPWRTATDNVAIVLEARGLPKEQARKQAASWLDLVGLDKFGNYYPRQLSGGMVQRVSIARAFAIEPDIILMDEPFSALDDHTTDSMLQMLQRVLSNYTATVFYVTHDFLEAVRISDRLFNLDEEELMEIPIVHRQELLQAYFDSRLNAVQRARNNTK